MTVTTTRLSLRALGIVGTANRQKHAPAFTAAEFAERYRIDRTAVITAVRADFKSDAPVLTRAIHVGNAGRNENSNTRRYPLPDLLRLARHHGLLPQRPAQSA